MYLDLMYKNVYIPQVKQNIYINTVTEISKT